MERRGHFFLVCPLILQLEHVDFERGGERVDILKSIR